MRTKFYINGKRITKKALVEMLGLERVNQILENAKEVFFEDPLTQNDFFLGSHGMLTINFE